MDDLGSVLEKLLTSVLVKSESLNPERNVDAVNCAHFQEDIEVHLDLIEIQLNFYGSCRVEIWVSIT